VADEAAVRLAAAARIGANDAQRLQRALEVIALSGRPLSAQQRGMRTRLSFRVLKIALVPQDRARLHARIAQRFDAMLADGFLEEMRRLRADARLHPALPAVRAVGYRQAWEYLDGAGDAAAFRDRAIFATRQLAKRQITWLRNELDAITFDPDRPTFVDAAASLVGRFLPHARRAHEM
jgi:tRNA dimethylallyltransferase